MHFQGRMDPSQASENQKPHIGRIVNLKQNTPVSAWHVAGTQFMYVGENRPRPRTLAKQEIKLCGTLQLITS